MNFCTQNLVSILSLKLFLEKLDVLCVVPAETGPRLEMSGPSYGQLCVTCAARLSSYVLATLSVLVTLLPSGGAALSR